MRIYNSEFKEGHRHLEALTQLTGTEEENNKVIKAAYDFLNKYKERCYPSHGVGVPLLSFCYKTSSFFWPFLPLIVHHLHQDLKNCEGFFEDKSCELEILRKTVYGYIIIVNAAYYLLPSYEKTKEACVFFHDNIKETGCGPKELARRLFSGELLPKINILPLKNLLPREQVTAEGLLEIYHAVFQQWQQDNDNGPGLQQ